MRRWPALLLAAALAGGCSASATDGTGDGADGAGTVVAESTAAASCEEQVARVFDQANRGINAIPARTEAGESLVDLVVGNGAIATDDLFCDDTRDELAPPAADRTVTTTLANSLIFQVYLRQVGDGRWEPIGLHVIGGGM